MKIQIEVEAIMDKCKDCSNFEVETLDLYGNEKLHRCKWMPYCSSIIEIWEKTKRGEADDQTS